MKPVVSICNDVTALRGHFEAHDPEGKQQGKINGRGGIGKWKQDNRSVICVTSTDGFDDIYDLSYMVRTSYEEVLGYTRQVEIDGVLQFGDDIVIIEPAHDTWVIGGYEDDLTKPIPVMEAVYENWERVFNDMEGNEVRIPEVRLLRYQPTGQYDGYYAKPIMVEQPVPERTFTYKNPIMEEVRKVGPMWAFYKQVYPRNPIQTEHGPYTPPLLMGVPLGWNFNHLTGI